MLVLALVAIWLNELTNRALLNPARWTPLRRLARAAVAVGGVLFLLGASALFTRSSFSAYFLFPSSSAGVGIALFAYGLHVIGRLNRRSSGPLAMTLVGLLVAFSVFWTGSVYVDALGRGRAQYLGHHLDRLPSVAVLAPRRLHIGPPVTERRLAARDAAYRYRYSGMRLLIRSGGKYFMVPDSWSHASGVAIVLADNPDLRFEFGP